MNKADLEIAENDIDKPTVNCLGFITYSNTINNFGIWLDKSGYLIPQHCFGERTVCLIIQKFVRNQKVINVGKLVVNMTS